MPSRSSRSSPASLTSLREPSGSASRSAMTRCTLTRATYDALVRSDHWTDADRFEIEQLIRPLVNLYRISSRGAAVAFVRQKRMAIKEDIRFFRDENETEELFRIKARSVMEFGGRYDVTAAGGEKIGVLGKVFGKSLLRSTWSVMDANEQELAVAKERSQFWAIVRRVIDAVPYGDFIPIVFHCRLEQRLLDVDCLEVALLQQCDHHRDARDEEERAARERPMEARHERLALVGRARLAR